VIKTLFILLSLKSKFDLLICSKRGRIYFFLFLPYLLTFDLIVSCKNSKRIKLTPTNEFIFETDFQYNYKNSNIIYSNELKKEVIYFADIVTKKKISFFELNGKKLYDIPLNYVTNNGYDIDSYEVLNKDSVTVLTLYSNIVFLLNKKGDCLKTVYLDSLIKNKNKNRFEYYSIKYKNKNNFILAVNWLGSDTSKIPQNSYTHLEYFYRNLPLQPKLVSLNIFNSNQNKVKWGLDSAYSKITKNNELNIFVETNKFLSTEKNIYFYSWYSDKIFQINKENLKLEKKITIDANGQNIGVDPKFLNQKNQNYIFDSVSIGLQSQASISNVIFDKYRNFFYVIVANKHDIKHKGKGRNYSLLIYDKNFEKINEVYLDKELYLPSLLFPSKKGVLIGINSKQNDNHNYAKFKLFKVDY